MPHNPRIDDTRTPTDGLPYYCMVCGKVYEGRHCEELNCELESDSEAQRRAIASEASKA